MNNPAQTVTRNMFHKPNNIQWHSLIRAGWMGGIAFYIFT